MRYRVFCECRMGILYLLYIFTNDYTIGHASTTLRLLYYIYDKCHCTKRLQHTASSKESMEAIVSTIVEII